MRRVVVTGLGAVTPLGVFPPTVMRRGTEVDADELLKRLVKSSKLAGQLRGSLVLPRSEHRRALGQNLEGC
ncbi:hypothetical protein N7468_010529 [Penicillium chermesinum]|uniref:Uncharacterized protein n=1 Tax=Penicillium chermesinum TaxID=63820 RepID=A0A9W9TAV0_9EURO|nr:uncharacterized protein N7468_010529 [Penicillium chermesinum]KAJ5214850.1 hypothetical protein N7468_010529 [Penicillium chermesinum]